MKRLTHWLKLQFVTPRCFCWAILLMLIAAGLATDTMVPLRDASGKIPRDPDGHPIFKIDQWASFWNGWSANVPAVLAYAFFVAGVGQLLIKLVKRLSPIQKSP